MAARVLQGDVFGVLPTLAAHSVRCCVTSPPYWGLRDYGHPDQLGLEATPDEYVAKMVAVFREVRRVLADDGTLWLNLGDSYAMDTKGSSGKGEKQLTSAGTLLADRSWAVPHGLKRKDLVGIPWMVAFALRADGWYLRQDIIWAKPNPMPESVTDRCTKAHEYLFLLSKSARYFYNAEAIAEPAAYAGKSGCFSGAKNASRAAAHGKQPTGNEKPGAPRVDVADDRNKRSVWTIATKPFKEAHFAVMPKALVEPCILAGSEPGDMILDPFGGSGTVAEVAVRLNREATMIELNAEYIGIANARLSKVNGEGPGQLFGVAKCCS